jgi:hypothetical protein
VITLPRLYLGLHYPTDMLAGAAIGTLCALVATRESVWRRCAPPILAWSEGRYAPWFGAVAFVVTFEIATLFDSVRSGARLLLPVVKPALTGTHTTALEIIGAASSSSSRSSASRGSSGAIIMARGGRHAGHLRLERHRR